MLFSPSVCICPDEFSAGERPRANCSPPLHLARSHNFLSADNQHEAVDQIYCTSITDKHSASWGQPIIWLNCSWRAKPGFLECMPDYLATLHLPLVAPSSCPHQVNPRCCYLGCCVDLPDLHHMSALPFVFTMATAFWGSSAILIVWFNGSLTCLWLWIQVSAECTISDGHIPIPINSLTSHPLVLLCHGNSLYLQILLKSYLLHVRLPPPFQICCGLQILCPLQQVP